MKYTGTTFTVDVKNVARDRHLRRVRAAASRRTGVAEANMKLLYRGKQLNYGSELEDYGADGKCRPILVVGMSERADLITF
mmetsp:Transcript_19457/g.47804  ORF Transcript_19457/g.47804 Transcript_19457/m.47804 type:complete len:81 (+) Transcript_19457:359-601(+)